MKRMQAGFTMIELIVVIVILGVLAATALPKFVDVRADAEQAAVDGVAGAMGSAMALNYGGCLVTNHAHSTAAEQAKCKQIDACSDVFSVMQSGVSSSTYVVTPTTAATEPSVNGTTVSCTVTKTVGSSTYDATFDGIGAGN